MKRIRMPYVTFRIDAKVNPATVKRLVAPFEKSCPSGPTFDVQAACRLLESRGYATTCVASDRVAAPFEGFALLVTRI